MSDPAFADLFAAMDIVIMERLPDRSFKILGATPAWFAPIEVATTGGDTATLERAFPFLDHFLEEAAEFWRQPSGGLLKSGPFSAKDSYGIEFHFEVSTVLADRRIFLLFQLLKDFEQTRTVLQRARERTLALQMIAIRREKLAKTAAALKKDIQALLGSELTAPQQSIAERIKAHGEALGTSIAELDLA